MGWYTLKQNNQPTHSDTCKLNDPDINKSNDPDINK